MDSYHLIYAQSADNPRKSCHNDNESMDTLAIVQSGGFYRARESITCGAIYIIPYKNKRKRVTCVIASKRTDYWIVDQTTQHQTSQ